MKARRAGQRGAVCPGQVAEPSFPAEGIGRAVLCTRCAQALSPQGCAGPGGRRAAKLKQTHVCISRSGVGRVASV